jgi:hypothetical protein
VTITPTASAVVTADGRTTRLPGRSNRFTSRMATPRPSRTPIAEPAKPIASASTNTARRTCRRLAPTARINAISRARCATMIEKEL